MTSFDDRAKDWDADPTKVDRAYAIADAITSNVALRFDMRALEWLWHRPCPLPAAASYR